MKKKNKTCLISLTSERPDYIKRSFDSLYLRAGNSFDHFVFDDGSDLETRRELRKLQKKYKFKLFLDIKRRQIGIYKRLMLSLLKIPSDYEYYIKFDSDVEVLSDNFLKEILSVFSFPTDVISCISPRIEGFRLFDRHETPINFYRGHVIQLDAPIVSGCCLVFPQHVFNSFPRLAEKKIRQSITKWGADTVLYDHAKNLGKCVVVEDLSAYHIDNAYGQRRVHPEYFTTRKRWKTIDSDQVWYILASKEIYPAFLTRSEYDKIMRISSSYKEFILLCQEFVKKPIKNNQPETQIREKLTEFLFSKKSSIIKKEDETMKEMYKIISPLNFKPVQQIPHGESRYFSEIPDWAKNNPALVIEKETVLIPSLTSEKIKKLEEKAEETGKVIRKCRECGYQTTSYKRMQTHKKKKHSIKKVGN
jgi:glycosyltransferase involved in cell wall biosynthesis